MSIGVGVTGDTRRVREQVKIYEEMGLIKKRSKKGFRTMEWHVT